HAAWFSVRQVVVALIIIAVLVALVVGPLLLEVIGNFFSKGVKKATPGGFALGLVVLLIGLASGVSFIIIAGAAVLRPVVLGVIIDNYLGLGGCDCGTRRPPLAVRRWPVTRTYHAEGGVACGEAALPWRTCRLPSRRAPGRLPGARLHARPEPRSS